MNTRDMWENQVELLTRHCRILSDQVDQSEQRITYLENVLATLLIALKKGGIIVDEHEDSTNTTYEF
tara:strand:- start:610 stop:810 length:201 start_codon:yes stop_codon:yes gene_type:complete